MDENTAIEALGALAQETRLRTFRLLMACGPEGLPAGEVARRLGTPSNTMSTHLAILTRAGLLRARREGRVVCYAVEIAGIRALMGFLVEACCGGQPAACAPLLDTLLPLECGAREGRA
ncbi:helix-turn-helix transcriptional regulator [Roseomonas frigidaquae]|uniref:Helix-turn-helix transcriptional regulator n=1 Tax=Falsiroseomonas frigidaquae TaxID=487318 RepID=A0ABX1F3G4_9PROT|nr:metalloregulator ArsR/SmtB family transcription factor [Falsiroseomonas frigidaquae]NKE46884.1 helix-turn-helix transcriptional regulator [Falsiroseomonas frigidaquae]